MKPLRALVLLVAASAATGCHGRAKSASEWSSKKTAFASGSVLRHAPERCGGGRLFLDLERAEKNEATRVAVEVLATRMFGGANATSNSRRVFGALRESFREEGLDAIRDTKELAVCAPGTGGGFIAVMGGDYSGKDVFRAIGHAAERLGDVAPDVQQRRGVEYMMLGRVAIARLAANVIAFGDDVEALTALGAENDRAARYFYTSGLVAAAVVGGEDDGIRVRVGDAGDDVTLEISIRTKMSAEELEGRRSGVATRVEETPLRGLGPLANHAKITLDGGRARLDLRGRANDVATALQTAAELPPAELKRIIAYVFGGADGTGTPEHKI